MGTIEKLKKYVQEKIDSEINNYMTLDKQLKEKSPSLKEGLRRVGEKTLCEGRIDALEDVLCFIIEMEKRIK